MGESPSQIWYLIQIVKIKSHTISYTTSYNLFIIDLMIKLLPFHSLLVKKSILFFFHCLLICLNLAGSLAWSWIQKASGMILYNKPSAYRSKPSINTIEYQTCKIWKWTFKLNSEWTKLSFTYLILDVNPYQ